MYFKMCFYWFEYSWVGDGVLSSFQVSGYSNVKDYLMNNDEKLMVCDMFGCMFFFVFDIDLFIEFNIFGGVVCVEFDFGLGDVKLVVGVDVYYVDQVVDCFFCW